MTGALARIDRLARRLAKAAADRGTAHEATAYRARAGRYAADPVGYAADVLGVTLTPQQCEIAAALLEPPYRVLVPSSNNQGKTLLAAVLTCWFHDTHEPSIVQATAPTERQVHDLLFKEIRRLRSKVPGASAGLAPRADRMERSPEWFVNGFTARNADSFQGTHGEHLGLLFDEGTGVAAPFWERAETMFGGHPGHWWLVIYNPNDASSPAYAAEETGLWRVVRLNALEHVNVLAELRGEEPPIPSAVRLSRVLDRIKVECEPIVAGQHDPMTDFQFPPPVPHVLRAVRGEPDRVPRSVGVPASLDVWPGAPDLTPGAWYRPKTPAFEAQVLGRWPLIPTLSLFSPALVDRCATIALQPDPVALPQIGCDVARFGDDKTAVAVRVGPCLTGLESHYHRDTTWIARRLELIADDLGGAIAARLGQPERRHDIARRIPIVVDGTGGYGAGVVDQLKGHSVLDLSMSSESPDPRCLRMRSYLWFKLAEYAHAGLLDLTRLTPDQLRALRGDLVAPRYRVDDRNRKVLEPKQQIKQRLGRSPDAGDAVALAYYTG